MCWASAPSAINVFRLLFTMVAMMEAPSTPPIFRQKPTMEEEMPIYFLSTLMAMAFCAMLISGPMAAKPNTTIKIPM
ncbi:hypothetical protein D3C73_1398660 [compost metagenome]